MHQETRMLKQNKTKKFFIRQEWAWRKWPRQNYDSLVNVLLPCSVTGCVRVTACVCVCRLRRSESNLARPGNELMVQASVRHFHEKKVRIRVSSYLLSETNQRSTGRDFNTEILKFHHIIKGWEPNPRRSTLIISFVNVESGYETREFRQHDSKPEVWSRIIVCESLDLTRPSQCFSSWHLKLDEIIFVAG